MLSAPGFPLPTFDISRTSAAALAAIRQQMLLACDDAKIPLIGVDFTSAPRRGKAIVVAHGFVHDGHVRVDRIVRHSSFAGFEGVLASPGPWVGGFDLPFGLPRELVLAWGWPLQWRDCVSAYAAQSRAALRERFQAFCATRPVGGKFAHRATDGPAGSSPSMKWVNPPVAWMLHAGAPRLISAGVTLPGMLAGDPSRIALEAYPGLLARSVTRASYKSDERIRQTPARRAERERIVAAMEHGQCVAGLPTRLAPSLRAELVDDASGDTLDSVLCLVQAGWGATHEAATFGLQPGFDPLEGWIVGAIGR